MEYIAETGEKYSIQTYNVKEFPYTKEELAAWDKEFMPQWKAKPIRVMEEADFAIRDIIPGENFLKWYQLRYAHETEWGKKYQTLRRKFF